MSNAVQQQTTENAIEAGLIDLSNPDKTFFKEVLSKYANFGIVSKNVGISSGNLSFGTRKEFRIPSGGDLLTKMYLNVTLPAVHNNVVTGSTYANWVNNIGHALINTVELQISNNVIDSHSGLYLDLWNELTDVDNKEFVLVNKHNDKVSYLEEASDENKKEWKGLGKYESNQNLKYLQTSETKYKIPLKFFFNRNYGSALPLFILGEDTVRIVVNTKSLSSLVLFDGTNSVSTSVNITSMELGYDTIELSSTEREAITRNVPSELLIETVQRFGSLTNFSNITIEHPVKELIFVLQKDGRTSSTNPHITLNNTVKGNDHFNYNGTVNTNSSNFDIFNTLKITWGSSDITERAHSHLYYREEQTQKYHSRNPDKNIYIYSFDIDPETNQPSGYINFSRDTSKSLNFTFTGLESGVKLHLFARSYEFLYIQQDRGDLRDIPIEGSY